MAKRRTIREIIEAYKEVGGNYRQANELNQKFQEFLMWYNTQRPHLGIDLMTPKEKLDSVSNVVKD